MSDEPEKMIRNEIYDSVPLGAKANPCPIICPACEGAGIIGSDPERDGASFDLGCATCDGKGTVISA